MSETITIPLTQREQDALAELSQQLELSPERVMLQALRQYQMVHKGAARIEMIHDMPKAFPTDEESLDRFIHMMREA